MIMYPINCLRQKKKDVYTLKVIKHNKHANDKKKCEQGSERKPLAPHPSITIWSNTMYKLSCPTEVDVASV